MTQSISKNVLLISVQKANLEAPLADMWIDTCLKSHLSSTSCWYVGVQWVKNQSIRTFFWCLSVIFVLKEPANKNVLLIRKSDRCWKNQFTSKSRWLVSVQCVKNQSRRRFADISVWYVCLKNQSIHKNVFNRKSSWACKRRKEELKKEKKKKSTSASGGLVFSHWHYLIAIVYG